MSASLVFFILLALTAVASAVGMLLNRNAVHAALLLIVNFCSVAVIYLTLGAPFIALAQITVYAGAIMILFLFVIMLLGADKLPVGPAQPWQRPLGMILGLLLMIEAGYAIVYKAGLTAALHTPASDYATPQAVGLDLYSHYLLPFELTSVILLVALIGAVVLTRADVKPHPKPRDEVEAAPGVESAQAEVQEPHPSAH
jgi:NADH-quinone oxidoreductase subunit J